MRSNLKPLGPIGRLGRFAAEHRGRVFVAWAVLAVGLGILAPRVEHALSGAGWHASGSESVEARERIDRDFAGAGAYALQVVLHSPELVATQPEFRRAVARSRRALLDDPAVGGVSPPEPGRSVSPDGHTAVLRAGAAADPNAMVNAAHRLETVLADAGPHVSVNLTGAPAMWSDFNQANKEAMLKSELISWPVTMAILVLAFGSLVAAGLPLMLTIAGLIASAGLLFLGTLISPISIWAMNFALMFALALGIDYALFIVVRYRAAHFSQKLSPVEAVATTMDTSGKAVLFSGLTVLVSLSAVMLVPSPAFRSTALGIIVAVLLVLAATLTLLPAVLAKLGPAVDRLSLPWLKESEHRSSRTTRWAELLWRRPYVFGGLAVVVLVALALPALSMRTAMPSITVVPPDDGSRQGFEQVQEGFGPGAPGTLQIVGPASERERVVAVAQADPGIARALPAVSGAGGQALIEAIPAGDPSSPEQGSTIDRLRAALPSGALVGGATAENHDLEVTLAARTPVVIGVVVALAFLLLLAAFQAPIAAAIGVVSNLFATAAAFGIAKWIFQDGWLAGLLGFESQGFLDAWAPVFFFAMIFAISMDYTVFLLSSAKEHWDAGRDARRAVVGGVTDSGRVIFAAGAVMVAVFFTFALSGPLPPKEMGVILGIAVLLDTFVVRLLLMPVLLRLVGPAAWYVPRWLERILPDVRVRHGDPAPARSPA